jgi:outer membrane protein TolC
MTELDSAVLAAARAAVAAAEKAYEDAENAYEAAKKTLHDILVEVWGDDA